MCCVCGGELRSDYTIVDGRISISGVVCGRCGEVFLCTDDTSPMEVMWMIMCGATAPKAMMESGHR